MANPTGKVVTLRARASQVSHLCFPVPGIIENLGTVLRIVKEPVESLFSRPIQLGDR